MPVPTARTPLFSSLTGSTSPATAGPRPPVDRVLEASLIVAPLAYLVVDCSYAARGWDDAATAAVHILAAVAYGLAALRLVSLASGRAQAALLVVAVLGIVGNAGVGENTLHIATGGNDLFDETGPANLFKVMGFFFPLTFLLAAVALRRRCPRWWTALLAVGAVLFPVAHVANIGWLAVLDALVMLAALGTCTAVVRAPDAV